jgi:hypothetical protein
MLHRAGHCAFRQLDKYYQKSSDILAIATVLDPRFNIVYYQNDTTAEGVLEYNRVKTLVEETFKKYQVVEVEENAQNYENTYDIFDEAIRKKQRLGADDELSMYFSLPIIDKKQDPPLWWRSVQKAYPSLSMMAKDFLQIVGTSAPSERVFSSAKHTLTDERASMKPETVRMTMCLKHWITKIK